MNGFQKMKVALEHQGWYVGWAIGFTQSEAWCDTPYKFPPDHPHAGKEVDNDKCLFNIIQDVELEDEYTSELYRKLVAGEIDDEDYKPYMTPEEAGGSAFCFGNAETLQEIIPIIEECGCTVNWVGSINSRPDISWGN